MTRAAAAVAAAAALMLVVSLDTANAASINNFPSIDFDLLGAVSIAGAFAGIEIWNQTGSTTSPNATYDANASTLLSRAANGTLSKLSATEDGGTIRAICQMRSSPNTVFVGGDFFSIGGTSVSNIAAYDPSTRKFSNLAGGLDGSVRTVYCDDEHQQLVVGGIFNGPVDGRTDRYLGNVAMWDVARTAWNPVDFGGLNGTVHTIVAGGNSSLVRFGGQFDTRFASMGVNGSQSGTNTSASSLTAALTPLSLGQVEFVGGPSSSDAGYSNPAQILCPQGADGSGNSYLFQDGAEGRLTARAFRALDVRAVRLGNTFVDGRGTRTFGIVSIPDNTELELIYLDPTTNQNVSCTNNCTLFHDTSVPYQDFLIADTTANNAPGGIKTLTGVQFTAYDYYGAGAGLHILELLSVGGWAYAYNALNRGNCESSQAGVNGTASSATTEGGWYTSTITTLAGTTEPVLALTDSYSSLSTDASSATVTWAVDIPYNGNYTINMFVPGCSASGQCGQRTDVNVNVFAVEGSQGNLTRVSQTNQEDQTIQIYSGEVNKGASGFQPTVILSIPADAPAPSGGDEFTIIADRISFVLRDSNETLSMSRSTGFGVLEFNLFDASVASIQNNGTGVLPNTTMTDVSTFATTLYRSGVRSNGADQNYVSSIATAGGSTFVGGAFTSATGNVSFANLAGFTAASNGNEAIAIANGGLNGAVAALATLGEDLYVGGAFTATSDGATTLSYVARYSPRDNVWTALNGGPDGAVSSVYALGSDAVLVAGSFATVNGTGQSGGYAVWNASTEAWQPQSSFLSADISASYADTASRTGQSFLAGSVKALSLQSASGAAQLAAPKDGGDLPVIESLNFQFAPTAANAAASSASSSNSARRRNANVQARDAAIVHRPGPGPNAAAAPAGAGSLASRLRGLVSRGSASTDAPASPASLSRRADAMQPASLSSDGQNEILASAFWQRDDGSYVNIIGGNFTTTAGIRNLAFYDDTTDILSAFPEPPAASGTGVRSDTVTVVRSLLVDSGLLYVGGDGGLDTYDLKKASWVSTGAPLATTSGQVLSVTAVNHRPDSSFVIVSGSFTSAGSLPCLNVCLWDTNTLRWSPLGAGLSGEISAIDFAASKANQLILAGSMTVNGVEASLASYDFTTQMWSSFGSVGTGAGQIPGPATAVSVNDLNANAIFVAGRTADGSAPYFVKWDGTQYETMGNGQFQADTGISQLTFVPINRAHPGNSVLENNRLLVISGALSTQDFGNVSSVFFDGQTFTPFLLATNLDGSSGIVRAFSRSTEVLKFPNLHRLAVGLVILISIAIGLGIVFLLVLIGLLWALGRRRPDRSVDVPISASEDSLAATGEKKRPSSLLATLNAATENAMLGGGAGVAAVGAGGAAAAASSSRAYDRPDSSQALGTDETGGISQYQSDGGRTGHTQYMTDEGELFDHDDMAVGGAAAAGAAAGAGAGAGAGAMEMMASDEDSPVEGIPAHARYDFVPNHESELVLTAGEPIEILDDQDKHWWLARNARGQTGVVPSSYV
ncbi:hypothetical protein BCV70DRAFT_198438, partial [Testicularia cyperi]